MSDLAAVPPLRPRAEKVAGERRYQRLHQSLIDLVIVLIHATEKEQDKTPEGTRHGESIAWCYDLSVRRTGFSKTKVSSQTWIGIVVLMLTAAAAQVAMGRKLWGTSGQAGLWSGDIWSSHNSQFLIDPYTLTHITHGILFYGLLALAFKSAPIGVRLLIAVGLESAWEVFENTSFVIERYRAETISLNYYGDSIANSMGDILACMLGFFLAFRLPPRVSILGAVALEMLLLIWTRDNLALNILMLIHPSPAVRLWQLGQ
jgi:Protein of unknown function (DUF2585)